MARPATALLRATLCCLIGGAFALAPMRLEGNFGEPSRWLLFTGGFHPMVLHLPIGIFIAIAAFEVWCAARRENAPALRQFLWLVAALSASASFITGYALASGGGHDRELLDPHLWSGGTFTGLCWLALGVLQLKDGPFWRVAACALAAVPMVAAGHYGGLMVHGSPFANAPWQPDPTAIEILPPPGEKIDVYADLVQPILTAKCQSCHGPGKQNGRLRIDSLERALAGGAHGPVLVPGHAKESRMLQTILLPIENDKHMPPKNRPQLNPAEVDLLHWWIEAGASPETSLAAKDAPEVIQPFLVPSYRLLPNRALLARQEAEAQQVRAAQAKRRATLEAALAQVPPAQRGWFTFTSEESADLEFAVSTSPEAFGDEQLAPLAAVLRECYRITLSGTKVTDEGLAGLRLAAALRELNLKRTPVANRGLGALAAAAELELLNIYGTPVDDGLAEQLPPLPGLRRLFVGDTRLSGATLAALGHKYPQAEIIGSLSVPVEIARATPSAAVATPATPGAPAAPETSNP